MASGWTRGTTFAAAALLAGAAVVSVLAVWMAPGVPEVEPAAATPRTAPRPAPLTSGPGASAGASLSGCAFDPMLPPSGPQDGQFGVAAALSMRANARPGAFIAVAMDVALAGRRRDGEVALIVACRFAEIRTVSPTVPRADAMRLLGDHYAANALASPDREELMARAGGLLKNSVRTYTAVLGANASRTRLASRRLVAVEEQAAGSGPAAGAAGTVAASGSSAEVGRAALDPGPAAGASADRGAGGPTGAIASVPVDDLVRADPELAQLEENLGRLRAQAASISPHPARLRREVEEARTSRNADCHDKECLLRWYASRRSELLDGF